MAAQFEDEVVEEDEELDELEELLVGVGIIEIEEDETVDEDDVVDAGDELNELPDVGKATEELDDEPLFRAQSSS